MKKRYCASDQKASKKTLWQRDEIASKIINFEQIRQIQSQRQFASEQAVPRTTLQYWLARKEALDASSVLISFLESPEGTAFLHRLVTALHLEFGVNSAASIHNISRFLKLCGLEPFIASSYSAQRRVAERMDKALVEYGNSERQRLAKNMPAKKITLCEDETFHPQICMVAIEAVSNFVLLEQYVQNRGGQTWNNVVDEALADLPVEVIQVVSDEAKGLLNHTTKGLNAHHSPDCFHVSHEIGRGTSGPLAAGIKKAEKQVETACKQTQKQRELKEQYDSQAKRPRGRRPNFEQRIAVAEAYEAQAEADVETARQNQEAVRSARLEIGKVYHPYHPDTGERQDAAKVSDLLDCCFEKINAAIGGLSDRCKKPVEKACRVVDDMVANVAFFFFMIDQYMDNMGMAQSDRKLMHEYLIPGFYLQQVAHKHRDLDQKALTLKKSQKLLSIFSHRNSPAANYSDEEINALKKAAKECAQIFQRSSSCVEGRNAQLSLRHHGIHRLSDMHLRALTIVHNYYIRNRDGTTPAERFFEAKHKDLFGWLLDNMDYPARPRKRLANAA